VRPGETDIAYQGRIEAMQARFDSAVQQASRGFLRAAMAAFESIVRDAGADYRDAGRRLAETRSRLKSAAQAALGEARDLEGRGQLNEAIARYSQAHEMDPEISVSAEVARIESAKIKSGNDACRLAKQLVSYNQRDRALAEFKKVISLLPESDPCYQDARRYLSPQ
jgi:tetratricopeptide (TPR) repeat protein